MYQKAEVRIIQDQQVDTRPAEVTSSEAADLLAKYGYSTEHLPKNEPTQVRNDLTIEQLYAQHDREIELQKQREIQRRNMPKAYTFNNNNINYSSTDYRSVEDGFGIQVQVVSDMPLYNNNRRY